MTVFDECTRPQPVTAEAAGATAIHDGEVHARTVLPQGTVLGDAALLGESTEPDDEGVLSEGRELDDPAVVGNGIQPDAAPADDSAVPAPGTVVGVDIRAIAFDVNGTLVEIWTDEHMEQIFRAVGHFLTYQGINLRRHQVRDRYFEILKRQQKTSVEEHPEFDAVAIWRTVIDEAASDFTRALPAEKLAQLPLFLAEMYRGISRRKLKLYPGVREMLDTLHGTLPLALVTDAQSAYARGELHKVGILDYFDPIVVSGDHGFRKPDRRLFQFAIDAMGVPAANTLYVGNDMHRDIHGAQNAGMQTMMFDSDQGTKHFGQCVPDHRITDYRDLLRLLGRPARHHGH